MRLSANHSVFRGLQARRRPAGKGGLPILYIFTVFRQPEWDRAGYAAGSLPITLQAPPHMPVAAYQQARTFAALDGGCHPRALPPETFPIKDSLKDRGASLPGVCGLCRPNNAASSSARACRNWLTCRHFGARFTAVPTACYHAGVAIVTNYDGASRRQNYIVMQSGRTSTVQ
jgi:hypothetical protein